ncbi:hypothetical protein ACHAQH_003729 [Verticillium albo-atrum]
MEIARDNRQAPKGDLANFQHFAHLPTELRNMIWEFAYLQEPPRVFEWSSQYELDSEQDLALSLSVHCNPPSDQPKVQQACFSARQLAGKGLRELCLPAACGSSIDIEEKSPNGFSCDIIPWRYDPQGSTTHLFDLSKDIVFIGESAMCALSTLVASAAPQSQGKSLHLALEGSIMLGAIDMSEAPVIAVEIPKTWETYGEEDLWIPILTVLRQVFRSLRKIYFVASETTEILSCEGLNLQSSLSSSPGLLSRASHLDASGVPTRWGDGADIDHLKLNGSLTRAKSFVFDDSESVQMSMLVTVDGGTAGCVVASRLSDADPNLSILVIECGQDNRDDPTVIHPIFSFGHMAPGAKTMLNYQSAKEPRTADRVINTATAGLLGGGSAINMSTYQRPQRFDYDAWETPGWSTNELLPYMKKIETYHGQGSPDTHGYDGPLEVTSPAYTVTKSQNDFIQAATQIGYPEVKDLQNFDTCNGVQRNVAYIGKDGRRQDAAHNYLYPRLDDGKHPNLLVLVEHQVVRVVFEGTKATGVEFRPNPLFQSGNAIQTVKARKLVVAASGAMATPLLLERSGLGDPEVLERAGVDLVADLPGVGTNYQDHQLSTYAYYTGLTPEETGDALFGGRVDVAEAIKAKAPILGWHLADSVCKVRPTDQEVTALGPRFQEAWDRDFKSNKDKPLAVFIPVNCYPGLPAGLPIGQYFGVSTWPTYPYSRGQLHITSPSLDEPSDFRAGFLTDDHDIDLKKSMWAYKKHRELMRRTEMYRGEVQGTHPPFAAESAAACAQVDQPLKDVKNIVYSAEDDAVLEQYIREKIAGCWHQMGTCKMAAREKGGVVDAALNVYGVQGLKIADLSIAPENLAANLANTAFVIGEKAADLIIADLSL